MALYERLMGLEQPKIPVHQFMAMVAERVRVQVTTQQVIDAFTLSVDEVTEITTLVARVLGGFVTENELHDVLMVAERLIPPYNLAATVRTRLGV